MALTFISISQAEKNKKRKKAKVSDSQLELIPLKIPRVPLGSFFPLPWLVSGEVRTERVRGQSQVQLHGCASLCLFWVSGGVGVVGTPEKLFLSPVS